MTTISTTETKLSSCFWTGLVHVLSRGNTAVHLTAAYALLFYRRTSHPPRFMGVQSLKLRRYWVSVDLTRSLGESPHERFALRTNFPSVGMIYNGLLVGLFIQFLIRNLQKQLFHQYKMISHKGFYWQNHKNKESCSSLTVTMPKHFSTNQALSGTDTHLESVLMWQTLQLISHFHYKEILNLQKWFLLSSETHSSLMKFIKTLYCHGSHTSKSRTSLSCKAPKEFHQPHDSLKFPLCTAQPMFWQMQFRQNFWVLNNASNVLRTVQIGTLTNSAADITCSWSQMACKSIHREY